VQITSLLTGQTTNIAGKGTGQLFQQKSRVGAAPLNEEGNRCSRIVLARNDGIFPDFCLINILFNMCYNYTFLKIHLHTFEIFILQLFLFPHFSALKDMKS